MKAGFYFKEHIFTNIWNIPLSMLWILTLINGFNLIDIMDGLAATIAICVSITLLIIAFILKNMVVVTLLAALIGALFAFFCYNKPPVANIYLGDAGALFIGGFLATIPFLLSWGSYTIDGYISLPIIFALPLSEVIALIIIRTYKGIPFYQGSPDHFACYLQAAGWNKKQILLYVFFYSLIVGSISLSFFLSFLSFYQFLATSVVALTIWFMVLFSVKRAKRAF